MLRRIGILAFTCQFIFVKLALAAEEHGEAAGGHEGPPPSLFSGDLGNALWTLAIFFLLLIVLGKFAWKPLLSALQNREKFIRESLEAAKRDREAAEARLKEYEQRIAKAHEESNAIVEEGRRNGETLKRKIEEEARASAEDMIERAKREIGLAKDMALKELYDTSAKLGTAIAGNLLKRQITPEDQRKLVEDALSELTPA
jgi:F-type H+-transporting ATPase subunit b